MRADILNHECRYILSWVLIYSIMSAGICWNLLLSSHSDVRTDTFKREEITMWWHSLTSNQAKWVSFSGQWEYKNLYSHFVQLTKAHAMLRFSTTIRSTSKEIRTIISPAFKISSTVLISITVTLEESTWVRARTTWPCVFCWPVTSSKISSWKQQKSK